MPDPRFFHRQGPFPLSDLAACGEAELDASADPAKPIHDVAPLDTAGADDVSFLDNPRYLSDFAASAAGACIVKPDYRERAPTGMNLIVTTTPYRAYGLVAGAFYPREAEAAGQGATARVDDSATVGTDASIDDGAVVAAAAVIGARSYIGPNVVIGSGVVIGEDCRIMASATLSHCLIGDRVVVHPGVRIGQDGFGFAPGPTGFLTIPQLGRVIIHDDADVGANTTIDRGSGHDTVVGAGTRIDNLAQIAHNVTLGRGCVLAAQVGIAGSTKIGDYVMIGGQAGLKGHLVIGDGARIAAKSGVISNISAGASYGGYPAVPVRDWHRQTVRVSQLARKRGAGDG